MRWPSAWQSPASLEWLQGTPVNCLLLDPGAGLGAVAEQARRNGLTVVAGAPPGIQVVKGEWPGVQMSSRHGGGASAGPTGVPWLDSNGWRVRLHRAMEPGAAVWVDAPPKASALGPGSFAAAYSDAAAYGGRWIIALDEATAAGVAAGNARAQGAWERLKAAAGFFDRHAAWADYRARGVLGVVSDFSGDNEFLSSETLNLLSRANQQYRVLPKQTFTGDACRDLRALLYFDAQPPSAELRRQLEALVHDGRLLIAGPQWGGGPGSPAGRQEYPNYELRTYGKGRVAVARTEPDDPYMLVNDAVLLLSHRYELLRFFNVGAVGSYLAAPPEGGGVLLQLVFYATQGPRDATVWVAGRYGAARLWTLDGTASRPLEVHPVRGGVEVHLPPASEYAALELET